MPITREDLLAEAKRLRDIAEGLERAAEAIGEGLPDVETGRTIRTVNVDTRGMPAAVKRGAARATRKHPAQQRFYAAKKTITDIAKELREGRERVSAWMSEGDGNRPIPRHQAEYLRDHYKVPLSAWKRIAD